MNLFRLDILIYKQETTRFRMASILNITVSQQIEPNRYLFQDIFLDSVFFL